MPGEESPELRRWLDQIARQARRAGDVIRRVTQFVRKGELDREVLDLNRCIRELSVLLEFGGRDKGISVAYELAERLPAVIADRVLIEQVLLNLVRNAADAMEDTPQRQRRIVIRTFADEQGHAGVAVSDSGSGVTQECMDRLFEPYFTTKADGTGMGLAICRSTIDAHNGRIWAINNPEGGATFQFTLPPAQPAEPAMGERGT
jgi:two-component system sensor histidine kinase DctS